MYMVHVNAVFVREKKMNRPKTLTGLYFQRKNFTSSTPLTSKHKVNYRRQQEIIEYDKFFAFRRSY